jgi:hypothetical protein
MSEKNPELDIKLRRANVAEVLAADGHIRDIRYLSRTVLSRIVFAPSRL